MLLVAADPQRWDCLGSRAVAKALADFAKLRRNRISHRVHGGAQGSKKASLSSWAGLGWTLSTESRCRVTVELPTGDLPATMERRNNEAGPGPSVYSRHRLEPFSLSRLAPAAPA